MIDKVVIEKRYIDAVMKCTPLDMKDRINDLLEHVYSASKNQHDKPEKWKTEDWSLIRDLETALQGVLSWAGEIAGDTTDEDAKEFEEITVDEARQVLKKVRNHKEVQEKQDDV